ALVAGASTVLGLVVQAASSVLDLRLQIGDLNHMKVHAACGPDCVSERIQATWHMEAKALLVGLVLLAITDLVMAFMVYAARGGSLVLGSSRAPSRVRSTIGAEAEPRLLLATALVGAGVIHAAVIPEHLDEWWAAGAFFVLLTIAEVGAAAAVLLRWRAARERTLYAVLTISLVPLLVWAVSRMVGLPFGPEAGEPESVGLADCMA